MTRRMGEYRSERDQHPIEQRSRRDSALGAIWRDTASRAFRSGSSNPKSTVWRSIGQAH